MDNEKAVGEAYPVRVVPGAVYRYHRGGLYRPLCVARHVHSGQELVVYEGVTGRDKGKHFAAPLFDFVTKFEPVATAVPAPEKAVGFREGPGY